jgi:Ca2+/Na+ antiporter
VLILVLLFLLALVAVAFFGLIYLIVRAAQSRPAPVPVTFAAEMTSQHQQRRDREHLKLLSIFHFVFGGLALVGIAFLFVHYFILHTVFSNPDMWKSQQQTMPPKAFLDAFIWFYLLMGVILLTGLILNVVSAWFLWRKKNRVFSLVETAAEKCGGVMGVTGRSKTAASSITMKDVRRYGKLERDTQASIG